VGKRRDGKVGGSVNGVLRIETLVDDADHSDRIRRKTAGRDDYGEVRTHRDLPCERAEDDRYVARMGLRSRLFTTRSAIA